MVGKLLESDLFGGVRPSYCAGMGPGPNTMLSACRGTMEIPPPAWRARRRSPWKCAAAQLTRCSCAGGKAGFPGEVRRAIAQERGRCIPRCIARAAGPGRSLSRPRWRGGCGAGGGEGDKRTWLFLFRENASKRTFRSLSRLPPTLSPALTLQESGREARARRKMTSYRR